MQQQNNLIKLLHNTWYAIGICKQLKFFGYESFATVINIDLGFY